MKSKIEQTVNGIKSIIKSRRTESTIEQYTDENGSTHFVSEIKRKKGNKIIIEREEWIM